MARVRPIGPISRRYAQVIGRIDAEPHGAAAMAPAARGGTSVGTQRVIRQVRRQVGAHSDRADPGPATTVRDAERLVQVQVRYIGAELTWARQTNHRVEVRSVDVDLSTGLVDERTHLGDVLLEHSVGRRVCHHHRSQGVGVRRDLGAQVVEIDLSRLTSRLDDDDAHAGHDRAGRVRAVCAGRNQAHVPMLLAPRAVVATDRQQPRELALGSGIRLQ